MPGSVPGAHISQQATGWGRSSHPAGTERTRHRLRARPHQGRQAKDAPRAGTGNERVAVPVQPALREKSGAPYRRAIRVAPRSAPSLSRGGVFLFWGAVRRPPGRDTPRLVVCVSRYRPEGAPLKSPASAPRLPLWPRRPPRGGAHWQPERGWNSTAETLQRREPRNVRPCPARARAASLPPQALCRAGAWHPPPRNALCVLWAGKGRARTGMRCIETRRIRKMTAYQ